MREILDPAAAWVAEERQFALAVLVSAQASSPRELGAAMIVVALLFSTADSSMVTIISRLSAIQAG